MPSNAVSKAVASIACPAAGLGALLVACLGGATEARAQMSYEEGVARERAAHHAQMMEHGRQQAEAAAAGGVGYASPAGSDSNVSVPIDSPELRALYFALMEPALLDGPPEPPAGAKVIHQSPDAVWLLFKASPARGQGCAAVYARGRDTLILAGPNGGMPGSITFIGEGIPAARQARETRISLAADGRPVDIRAIHAPGEGGGVLVAPAVIQDTLPSIGDSETLTVRLDGRTVYEIRTEGAFKARDALRGCLAGTA